MCAIFGCFGDFDTHAVDRAFTSLKHRGPDESHLYAMPKGAFGHHRLAVVDPTHQQVVSCQEVHIAFNGEIYNFQKIKAVLSDFDFKSEGDAEVILAAYLSWGEDFIEKLEGMFAIAILDERSNKVLLYRDRLGKKPLYYYHHVDSFVFSSEIKAFTNLGITCSEARDVQKSFLSFQTALAPHTFYKEIVSLQAGEMLIYEAGQIRCRSYDDIMPKTFEVIAEGDAIEVIHNLLDESIQKRLPQEIKPAFLLSGGLDSSLLCAMAQRHTSMPIETFSLGYEGKSKHDETAFAKEVADYIGAKNERIVYTFEDFKKDMQDPFIWTDQPLNDPAMFPLAHLLKQIKAQTHTKVVLSGEGSDELFLGYRPYKELEAIEPLRDLKSKNWLKNFLLKHPDEHREWEWYRRVLEDEVLFRSSAESFTPGQRERLLKAKCFEDPGFKQIEDYEKRFKQANQDDPLLWYRYIDLKVHQSDYFLMKLDRVSMYYGLEARTPFLDETLVKKSLQMPSSLFLDGGVHKKLIKNIALHYLPRSIVERKKRGFSYPYLEWLQDLGGFHTIRQLNEKHQFFDAAALKEHLRQAEKGAFKHHTFGIYLLLLWLEKNN